MRNLGPHLSHGLDVFCFRTGSHLYTSTLPSHHPTPSLHPSTYVPSSFLSLHPPPPCSGSSRARRHLLHGAFLWSNIDTKKEVCVCVLFLSQTHINVCPQMNDSKACPPSSCAPGNMCALLPHALNCKKKKSLKSLIVTSLPGDMFILSNWVSSSIIFIYFALQNTFWCRAAQQPFWEIKRLISTTLIKITIIIISLWLWDTISRWQPFPKFWIPSHHIEILATA